MRRLKIRNKTEDKPGVDSTSFKLGYQQGFREAEEVTTERLLLQLNEDLEKKQKKYNKLFHKYYELKNSFEEVQERYTTQGSRLLKLEQELQMLAGTLTGTDNVAADAQFTEKEIIGGSKQENTIEKIEKYFKQYGGSPKTFRDFIRDSTDQDIRTYRTTK